MSWHLICLYLLSIWAGKGCCSPFSLLKAFPNRKLNISHINTFLTSPFLVIVSGCFLIGLAWMNSKLGLAPKLRMGIVVSLNFKSFSLGLTAVCLKILIMSSLKYLCLSIQKITAGNFCGINYLSWLVQVLEPWLVLQL